MNARINKVLADLKEYSRMKKELEEEIEKRNIKNVSVTQTGCIGMCQYEPIIEVYAPGKEKVTYVQMTAEKAVKVVANHLINGEVVMEYTVGAVTE